MALLPCTECQREVSTKAKTCPGCGAPAPKPKFELKNFLVGLAVFLLICTVAISSCNKQMEKNLNTLEALEKKHRQAQIISFVSAVKDYVRDPKSLEFIKVTSTKDASTVCMQYRARNGFGGMVSAKVVFQDTLPMQDDASWQKYCPKPNMLDVTSLANIAI